MLQLLLSIDGHVILFALACPEGNGARMGLANTMKYGGGFL